MVRAVPLEQRESSARVRVQTYVTVPRCGAATHSGQCVRTQQYAGLDAGSYLVDGEVVWLCTQHARMARREGWRKFNPQGGAR